VAEHENELCGRGELEMHNRQGMVAEHENELCGRGELERHNRK
jgi:hypothetical protein